MARVSSAQLPEATRTETVENPQLRPIETQAIQTLDDDDDAPLREVPMLPRTTGEHRAVKPTQNGKTDEVEQEQLKNNGISE